MSRFVACLTDCEQTLLADLCYEFIQQKGELPSDDELYHIIKQSHSLDDAFHQINQLFAMKTKEALLNAVSIHHRYKIAEKLITKFKQSTDSPADDSCSFQFRHYDIENPDMESLLNLYDYLETMEVNRLSPNMNIQKTLILDVSKQVSDSVLDVVEEGVYLPVVDSSCGESETIIIELAFLRDMAKKNENTKQILEDLYNVLAESRADLNAVLHQCEPYLLVLQVSLA
ncbi:MULTISPECIES: hypothetical protein [unclassified Gilliamella]|uniref:hypothetical protein n=1 Tax=unclassified Gilliamella TaxID=2685620 RepID=UPI00226A87AF|nr:MULTISPECIES: hypothetical protein [unclassified Gilliamella]MCX8588522.1 hypothetical protein [Gilliamella sp. B3801]MCX8592960.1 hypothetical protein [Gilliamella sp. B3804]